ncbi:hypothetical protein ACS0TY_023873 [Phlomoides rotata]
MAEESEKRFDAIMNKLFHTPPKSKLSKDSSGHGVQNLSGRKRLRSSSLERKLPDKSVSSLSGLLTSAQSSPCRPWDRGDLFKRLSTFKSMTWFAKPQVVSPLECVRRGWINVDVDTIACAACDARLLFSTPSAWTQQQVEKAAMVFSLKLESGHKLLCPWINNSCPEKLAQFPILSRASLIEDYKKRFFALSQLIALPVILPVAIDALRTSEIEQFLSKSLTSECQEQLGNSGTEFPGHVSKTSSTDLYHQAQKLISLFGWEPRVLSYAVELKDGPNGSVKDANVIVTTGQKSKDNVYSSVTSEGTDPSSDVQFDPSSVVLDCKLCGASVGLWAFSTIPQPLEYIRFVGLSEVTSKIITTHDDVGTQEGSSGSQIRSGSREGITNSGTTASTSLGFTIAGGPPPAKLNYGATISLPIIGQNLRARLPLKTGIKDHSDIQMLSQVEDHQVSLKSENANAEETSATMGPDSFVGNLLEVPEYVAEDSNMNMSLAKTVMTVDSTVADHPRLDAPEDNTSSRKGGRMRENKKLSSLDKPKEFDPIKQHRHFCPWITSTGKVAPGWQQTLSALEGHKELGNVHSSTLIEVDDPVESVQSLFSSPNEKRSKICGGS